MVKKERKPTKLDALCTAVEQSWAHNDSRVIVRKRDVLLFELQATEEHINSLRASLIETQAHRACIEAKITGLTRVLGRR